MKEKQPPRESPQSERRLPGLYQVWHANDLGALHQSRMERQPYVHGYTLAGSVEARDLEDAVTLANDIHRRGWRNPEVKATVIGSPRFTLDGDVIVDPQGRAYFFEGFGSFREIEAGGLGLAAPDVQRAESAATVKRSHYSSLAAPKSAEQQHQPQKEHGKDNGNDQGFSM